MPSNQCLRRLMCCLSASILISGAGLYAEDTPLSERVKVIGLNKRTGIPQAVIVEHSALIHTQQIVPRNQDGEAFGKNAEEQTAATFTLLQACLDREGSDFRKIVKLNVYVANLEVADVVRRTVARQASSVMGTAVSFVETTLPGGALVAMDAVAIVSESKRSTTALRRGKRRIDYSATLPAGPSVYISGQAEKGTDLGEATTKTLDSLLATLLHLKLEQEHVVQVKCFLTPMADVKKVEEAIVEHFKGSAPPCVFVEWQSTLPIEIEMIVADPVSEATNTREPLEFITPPGMTASPVFCRVVRINHPQTIYVSGLYSREAADGAGQVTDVFAQLQEILKASGSDMRHLAKATYYVSDNEASTKLNEIRPKLYDPQRPPAASKAQVFGVGMPGRSLTLDMIAVPAK